MATDRDRPSAEFLRYWSELYPDSDSAPSRLGAKYDEAQKQFEFERTQFAQPDIFGSAGAFGSFTTGSGDTRDSVDVGERAVTINGKQYVRTGEGPERFRPFVTDPSQLFYDPTYGWVVDPQVNRVYANTQRQHGLANWWPMLGAMGMLAGPLAASMGAAGAGAAAAGAGEGVGANAYFAGAGGADALGAGAGLGEGIGANAYFAGAQAPGSIGAGAIGAGGLYSGAEFQGVVPPQSTGAGPTFDAFGNPIGGGGYFPAGSAGAGATGATGSTALARLLGLGQTGSDILSVWGSLLPGLLGYLGAGQQSDAYRDVASQYFNIGAPYRDTLQQSYQPGFDLFGQPGYGDAFNRAADVAARSYGARFGNPAGSPTAQAGILGDVWSGSYLPALANYRGQLGQYGGLGLNTSGAAQLGGAQLAGGGLNAIGYGLQGVLNPQPTLADILKQMGGGSPNYSLTVGGTRI